MIVGLGVDLVDVERFKWLARKSPGSLNRMLRLSEQVDRQGRGLPAESLAARFAAKEAVAKALGNTHDLQWDQCEIVTEPNGAARIALTGEAAARAAELGIDDWFVSLSHDGDFAFATVIAQRRP